MSQSKIKVMTNGVLTGNEERDILVWKSISKYTRQKILKQNDLWQKS